VTYTTATGAAAQLVLEVPVDAPLRGVIDTESDFLGVVGEVGREVTELSSEPVRWLLAHARTNGVIQLRLRGVPANDRVPAAAVPQIVRAVSHGLVTVETTAERPDYFTDRALELSQDIAERSREIGPVRVTDGDIVTPITPAGVGQHVTQLLGARYSDYGSVEGRLEGVIIHGDRYFNVYDELTGRRIRCHFANRIPVRHVADALEHRVAVYGQITYRSGGDIATVVAEELIMFPSPDLLPTADDVRGILG
jgi:hypothetical protein